MRAAPAIRVLLIEHADADALRVCTALARADGTRFEIVRARRLDEALAMVGGAHFDVVLAALDLPDAPGNEAVRRLLGCCEELALVVLGACAEDPAVLEATTRGGAQDYLIKGQGDGLLMARALRHAIERKRAELRLSRLAHFDTLTGLANRNLFQNRLARAIARAARKDGTVALMFIDLDRFKAVNDTLGHGAGDALLVHVAERLRSCVREADTIARLGGDEFTVIVEHLGSVDAVAVVAQKILNAMTRPFRLEGREVYVTPSIGITLYPHDDRRIDELLKNADSAMYKAKEQGRNNYQFYRADMHRRSLERFDLENKLRMAVERREFVLHYQPKVDVGSGRIVGVEALVRWQHGAGLVSPAKFIPIAEETGLIVPVGEWVLREAAAQLRRWLDAGHPPLTMAVNLSPRQFRQLNLSTIVAEVVDGARLDPAWLELEITETLLMEDTQTSSATLAALKQRGVKISVDDFGTGYSSLNYLKRFPIDTLKIDQSFVRDITSDADDAAIASAIIALAHSLRLEVVAEGVETEGQLAFLREHGCDLAQGYLFSRPLPAAGLSELLHYRSCQPSLRALPAAGPACQALAR